MLPFSFAEFIEMNDKNKRVDQLFNEYLLYGSLPEVVNIYQNSPENANDYIDAVIESVVEKDVEFRHKFRDNELLTKVIKFLFDSVGSPISAGNIAKSLAVSGRPVSNHTIDNILEALTRSFIFYKSQRYDIRGKELLKTLSKYYAVDLGMRNRMLGRDSGTDLGHLLENVVYFELLRRESKISTGKIGEKEVDFSIIDNNGRISYIQVAWSTYDEKTLEHELAPLKAIKDSNAKILITTDINIGQTYDGIRKINVIDWLLDDQMNLF
jgi:predicted AAA+ superfamily ATPase